jgi:excisionase family DNA binding protein
VQVVKELIEAFVETGGRAKAAAEALNGRGYTTRRGSTWTDTAVGRVLRNPALKDLVPEELWCRCQESMSQRENSPGRPARRATHPLGGVVHCRCTGRMYLRTDGTTPRFVCKSCQAKIPEETLERLFAESLSSVVIDGSEVVAAAESVPVANELGQAVGDGAVSVADAWPLLKRQERCQLVDLLVSRIDVDEDTISVDFSGSVDSEGQEPAVSANSLPSPQGFESSREPATRHDNRFGNRDLAPLLTVEEVADLLRRSSKSIYSMIERAQLPGVTRLGRRVLVRRDDLLRWLNESRASSRKERRP